MRNEEFSKSAGCSSESLKGAGHLDAEAFFASGEL